MINKNRGRNSGKKTTRNNRRIHKYLEHLTSIRISLKNISKLTPDADAIQKGLLDNGNILKKTNNLTEEKYVNSDITAANVEVLNHLETSDKEMGKKKGDYRKHPTEFTPQAKRVGYIDVCLNNNNDDVARKSIKRNREEEN